MHLRLFDCIGPPASPGIDQSGLESGRLSERVSGLWTVRSGSFRALRTTGFLTPTSSRSWPRRHDQTLGDDGASNLKSLLEFNPHLDFSRILLSIFSTPITFRTFRALTRHRNQTLSHGNGLSFSINAPFTTTQM